MATKKEKKRRSNRKGSNLPNIKYDAYFLVRGNSGCTQKKVSLIHLDFIYIKNTLLRGK